MKTQNYYMKCSIMKIQHRHNPIVNSNFSRLSKNPSLCSVIDQRRKRYLQLSFILISFICFFLLFMILFVMLGKHDQIYEELRPFYQLIYIFDIQKYSLNDLKSLTHRLQGQLSLDAKEKIIHEEIILKSRANVERKLKQKRSRIQSKSQKGMNQVLPLKILNINIDSVLEESRLDEDDQNCYINESCIIPDFPREYREQQSIEGKIYDGKLMISLPTTDSKQKLEKSIYYEVVPALKDSTINRETLKQLNLDAKSSQIKLNISGKEIEARILECQSNILGLDYLRANNVIIKCNYRTEASTFSMIFTE